MIKKLERTIKIKELKNEIQRMLGKITKVKKSIICCIMVIIAFSTVFTTSTVRAENLSEFELYSKENIYCFRYRGYLYRSEFVVYNFEGKEYPAYCLNRELDGVSLEHGGYKVKKQDLITNELVWKAIINGYPYKTYQELGCNSEIEAFTATKLAVYDMMYNYNLNDFVPVNDVGERVVAAIKNISDIARHSTQNKINPQLQIQILDEHWKIDEKETEYISKKFKVNANSELLNYIVQVDKINGIKITNLENQEQNVFENLEEFKILIPIKELNQEQKIQISAFANLKTYPIYYGKAPETLQNYAISGFEYENVEAVIQDNVPKNETSLSIEKIDAETKEYLSNFQFLIINDKTNQNIQSITDEFGKIELKNLLPGEYTIREEKGQENYIIKEGEIKVKIELNQKYKLVVENNKKIVVEEIIEEPIEEIIEEPVEEIIEEPVKEIIEEPVKEIIEEPVKEIIEEPVEEIIEEPVEEIIEEPIEEITEKPIEEIIEEPIKLPKTGF